MKNDAKASDWIIIKCRSSDEKVTYLLENPSPIFSTFQSYN